MKKKMIILCLIFSAFAANAIVPNMLIIADDVHQNRLQALEESAEELVDIYEVEEKNAPLVALLREAASSNTELAAEVTAFAKRAFLNKSIRILTTNDLFPGDDKFEQQVANYNKEHEIENPLAAKFVTILRLSEESNTINAEIEALKKSFFKDANIFMSNYKFKHQKI